MIIGLVAALSALQAQNTITVSDVSLKQGEAAVVSVELNNETEFTAFQMSLKLPEGFSVATTFNEDGDEVLDIELNADRKKSTHSLTYFIQDDGSINMVVVSLQNATFKGTSGEIVKFRIIATDAAVVGDYKAQLYKIIFSDVNGKETIFADKEFGLNYSASAPDTPDVPDVPDTPDVPDVPDTPDVPEDPEAPVNEISAADIYIEGEDGSAVLSVELSNETAFSGFQMDFKLPEGFAVATTINEDDEEVLDISLGEERKKTTHTLDAQIIGNGVVRVVSVSTANATYKGTSGEIVKLRIVPTEGVTPGTYKVEVYGVRFSTTESVEFLLSDISAQIVFAAHPLSNVELSTGLHGRCILNGNVVAPEQSYALSCEYGSVIKLYFVPFEGYSAISMKRNGEVVAINDNVYEETVKGDVAFTEVNYVRLSEEIEELPEPIITFDAGEVSIECERDDVTILYAINGNPLEGDVYVEPFTVPERSVVSAVAVRVSKVAELTIIASDMEESPKRVAARRYYKENGIRVASAEEGVTIVVDEYEDGSMQAYKVVGN